MSKLQFGCLKHGLVHGLDLKALSLRLLYSLSQIALKEQKNRAKVSHIAIRSIKEQSKEASYNTFR